MRDHRPVLSRVVEADCVSIYIKEIQIPDLSLSFAKAKNTGAGIYRRVSSRAGIFLVYFRVSRL